MTVRLAPYPAYKDSGVDWLGEIPADWSVKRLKDWVEINNRTLPESTDPDYAFRYIDIGSVSTGHLVKPLERLTFRNAPSRARRVLTEGDTIISTVRTYLKAIYFIADGANDLIASTGFAVLTPGPAIEPSYLSYLIRSAHFVDRVTANSIGIAYPAIAESSLGRFYLAVPSTLDEQRTIAAFLDHQDRQITRLIRAKRRLIDLLTEQKQAIIQQAVTRGLDPNVRLKDSGVAWLGEVPEHWEVKRAGSIFHERNQSGTDDLPVLVVSLNSGVTVGGDVNDDGRPRHLIEDRSAYKMAKQGDIAYNMMRMWQGASGVVPVDGLVSPAYVVAHPLPDMNSQYFAFVLRTDPCKDEINARSRGIVPDRNRLYWEDFKALPLPVPNTDEQDRIVNAIKIATERTGIAISSAQREIDLLREYRTRLIADVVTGKLDVRGVELPVMDEPTPLYELEADGEMDDEEMLAAAEEDAVYATD